MRAAHLAAAVRWDARLQLRHGFYAAAAFVAAVLVLGLSRLPYAAADVGWLAPAAPHPASPPKPGTGRLHRVSGR